MQVWNKWKVSNNRFHFFECTIPLTSALGDPVTSVHIYKCSKQCNKSIENKGLHFLLKPGKIIELNTCL